ncbi:DUF2332 family protein [Pseudonocardia thermophila]|uniref:DUF2332 family protein n=1 Tax=Pseudonocardia thermophila TaxID=1848 RepID=UPI00190EA041|nr:DUF2332 family protein [Pseudonocardia thermophila]
MDHRRDTHRRATVQAHVAAALRASAPAAVPAGREAAVLAALHHLALAGRAPELAAAYEEGDAAAAAEAALDVLERMAADVAELARRRPLPDETGHPAVLYPLIAEAAHRSGAGAVGLVDVGRPAGLNLTVDRAAVAYDDGRTLGDPASPVQVAAAIVGGWAVPDRPMPPVAARIVVDRAPLDVTDPDVAGWLRACLPPGDHDRAARLAAEIALAAADPPERMVGNPVDLLAAAVALVPDGALPVVVTTWALSRFTRERRRLLLQRLAAASAEREIAWVTVEGVGVAPEVPTFGDRPASGHSILGLVRAAGGRVRGEGLGRCWLRGRMLAWLASG